MSTSRRGLPSRLVHHLLEVVGLDDVVGRVGRRDDDVRDLELRRQLVEAHRFASEALGQADSPVVSPIGDEHRRDPAGGEGPGDQLRCLAGADHQHPAAGQVAEGALGELDRDGGDRHALLAHPGLLPGAATGGERSAEEPVEDRAGGPLDQRQLVGALHLPLDLRLADDHRVEACGDPEEVADRLTATSRVEVADQLGRPDVRLAGEHPERHRLRLDRVGDDQVELGPVAGRDRRRFAHLLGGRQLGEGADGPPLGQGEALAQLERRGLVGDAEGEEL